MRVLLLASVLLVLIGCTQPIPGDAVDIKDSDTTYEIKKDVLDPLKAPFIIQAPFADWDDPRQQDACEEASVIMAVKWSQGVTKISKADALDLILDIAKYEDENYGANKDTSIQDTYERIVKGYFKFENASLIEINNVDEIVAALDGSSVVIMPADGKALNNPNFSGDGPEKHMLLLKGYDVDKEHFITNDPGTRNGENFIYSKKTIEASLKNYRTSEDDSSLEKNAVIVIRPSF